MATELHRTMTINRPRQELYAFWRQLDNLPRFMDHLESVTVQDDRRSHWVAKAPAGRTVEWDAEITVDEPGEVLAWHSLDGADVPNGGKVRFIEAPPGRGTEVHVLIHYELPAGPAGKVVAKLFGEEPDQQVREDLRRFKRVMETGEVATTEGQPSGRAEEQASGDPIEETIG
jgi:uncharacterized membrane protein